MNNGEFLKTFVTIGDNANALMKKLIQKWQYGLIDHLNSHTSVSTQESIFISDSFVILIVDDDKDSLMQAISLVTAYPTAVDLTCIHLNQSSTRKNGNITHSIAKSISTKALDKESLTCVLECYAHALCGSSIACLDFMDLHEWLMAGDTFKSYRLDNLSEEITEEAIRGRLNSIQHTYAIKSMAITGINAVLVGQDVSFSALAKTSAALSHLPEEIHISMHSNSNPNNCDLSVILFIAAREESLI